MNKSKYKQIINRVNLINYAGKYSMKDGRADEITFMKLLYGDESK